MTARTMAAPRPGRRRGPATSGETLPDGLRASRAQASLLLGSGSVLAGLVAVALADGQPPASPVLALLLASALPGALAASPSLRGQLDAAAHDGVLRITSPLQLALLLAAVALDGADSPLVLLLVVPLLPAGWSMTPQGVAALGAAGVAGLAAVAHAGGALTASAFGAAAVMALVTTASGIAAHAEQRLRTAQASLNAELTALARRDGLTGCLNHRAFHERLAEEVTRARRYQRDLALLLLDLDDFKDLNDTYGHPAGDRVLRTVGSLLGDLGRSADVPGRLGGDEFALLLPETSAADAEAVAERLRRRVRDLADPQPVVASIGISALSGLAGTARELVQQADTALYTAKGRGRGLIHRFDRDHGPEQSADGDGEDAEGRRATRPAGPDEAGGADTELARLVVAVTHGERIDAAAAPVVRLADGTLSAYLAVGRVRGSTLDLARWLQLADASGHRGELEAAWWAAVRRHGPPPNGLPLLVELGAHTPARALRDALTGAGAPAEPAGYRAVTRSLAAWAEATTTLSVDEAFDDGWARGPLDRLGGFEPRWLQLPTTLVASCDRQPGRLALVSALRAFADRAGGCLLAGGVSRDAEAQALRVAGVAYAHGPLFGEPGPPWPAAARAAAPATER